MTAPPRPARPAPPRHPPRRARPLRDPGPAHRARRPAPPRHPLRGGVRRQEERAAQPHLTGSAAAPDAGGPRRHADYRGPGERPSIPLRRLRQPHPLRRHHLAEDQGLPPLHRGRRPRRRGRAGARPQRGRGRLPLVRPRAQRGRDHRRGARRSPASRRRFRERAAGRDSAPAPAHPDLHRPPHHHAPRHRRRDARRHSLPDRCGGGRRAGSAPLPLGGLPRLPGPVGRPDRAARRPGRRRPPRRGDAQPGGGEPRGHHGPGRRRPGRVRVSSS